MKLEDNSMIHVNLLERSIRHIRCSFKVYPKHTNKFVQTIRGLRNFTQIQTILHRSYDVKDINCILLDKIIIEKNQQNDSMEVVPLSFRYQGKILVVGI